jgi:hypothetical protein
MLASGYPLLDAFWTILWIFCFTLWIFLVVYIFMDIFRSRDMNGWGKAGWSIFIIFLPFLGVFVYLIARGKSMAERNQREAQENEAAFQQYVKSVAADSGTSKADEVAKLADLHSQNILTDAEFEEAKAKILSS